MRLMSTATRTAAPHSLLTAPAAWEMWLVMRPASNVRAHFAGKPARSCRFLHRTNLHADSVCPALSTM
jgi:hypothetical protein